MQFLGCCSKMGPDLVGARQDFRFVPQLHEPLQHW